MTRTFFLSLMTTALLISLAACGDNYESTSSAPAEDTGIVTTLREMPDGEFKIEDEQIVSSQSASAIIAKYADNTSDTVSLSEAKAMMTAQPAATDTSSQNTYYRRSPWVTMATYGVMGYMMGRSSSFTPSPGAYVDPKTYNRVNSSTGTQFRNATARTGSSRPSGGKSGYGGGGSGSTRSYGG